MRFMRFEIVFALLVAVLASGCSSWRDDVRFRSPARAQEDAVATARAVCQGLGYAVGDEPLGTDRGSGAWIVRFREDGAAAFPRRDVLVNVADTPVTVPCITVRCEPAPLSEEEALAAARGLATAIGFSLNNTEMRIGKWFDDPEDPLKRGWIVQFWRWPARHLNIEDKVTIMLPESGEANVLVGT